MKGKLISMGDRPIEERKAIGRKGGLASARARRERMEQAARDKEMAAGLHEILTTEIPDGKLKSEVAAAFGKRKPTYQDAMIYGAVNKSILGNAQMFNAILEAIGQRKRSRTL